MFAMAISYTHQTVIVNRILGEIDIFVLILCFELPVIMSQYSFGGKNEIALNSDVRVKNVFLIFVDKITRVW